MTSGADTNIIGSQVSGKKVNMEVGGNLNIESLQEKDDYREKNSSSGFNISASMSGGINTNDPDIAASYSKGKIHSNWKSITGQAGIYAGADGFDIHVKKNTDLKGSVIASEAASDKNTLSTGTLTYGNIENSASYSASSKGLSYRKFASGAYGAGEGYNMKGLTPVLSVPAQGDAASTTKSAIAPGSIDVRKNPDQDLSDLSRNTSNALNELGRIFDKKKIEEQQKLASVFGEEAFKLAHKLPNDGKGTKILVHAAIGGIMSSITGAGFTSGAVGAGLNEAVIKEIDKIAKHDPGAAQIVSAIIGAAAAKAAGGTAEAGASAAASGTKWNLLREEDYNEKERRLAEATTEDERQAIEAEYREKDKEQEEEQEEAKTQTARALNNKYYQDHVAFNGFPFYHMGEIEVLAKSPFSQDVADFTSGALERFDANMSFGIMREIFRGIRGRYPYVSASKSYLAGRLFGDTASIYAGTREIILGLMSIGGGGGLAITGSGAVATPGLVAEGATLVVHGGTSAYRGVENAQKDLYAFFSSRKGVETPTPERGIGGKGWRGDKLWKENVKTVEQGGDIEKINGTIVTQKEAETLIKEAGGTPLRAEPAHKEGFNSRHRYPHINYTTATGKKGTIRIQEVVRPYGTGKFQERNTNIGGS